MHLFYIIYPCKPSIYTSIKEGGDFLPLVFGLPFAPELRSSGGPSQSNPIVSRNILTYWSNFAYTG